MNTLHIVIIIETSTMNKTRNLLTETSTMEQDTNITNNTQRLGIFTQKFIRKIRLKTRFENFW